MKIIPLQIYLFMCYKATESLTNIPVTLGADFIITCDLDIKEIYWYKLKLPDPPVLILRTYDSIYEIAKYGNSIFKHKYSVKTNSRLFIKNITIDELGVYYCVKTSEPQKFSNGTKIYISDFVQKNITDSVHRNQTDDAPQHQIPWKTLTITSVLMNVLLTIALIGIVKSYLDATGKSAAQNSNNPQRAEIDFSMCSSSTRPFQEQSTTVYSQYLLIWCQAAETLTDLLTDLGQNAIVNCDLDVNEVNWLLLKLPDPPVLILRSSTTSATFYYSKTFRQKYLLQSKHHLLINNITIDDLGLYYCVSTGTPPKYSNGTKLHIIEPTKRTEEIQNHTTVKHDEKNQTHWQIIIFISAFINGLLIIVIIGLLKVFVHARNRDDLKQFQDTNLKNLQDLDFEQPQDSTQTLIYYMKI